MSYPHSLWTRWWFFLLAAIFEIVSSLFFVIFRAFLLLYELVGGRRAGLLLPRSVAGKGAIVLIHGANMDHWCMAFLKRRLCRHGWGPVYDFQLGPLDWTIEKNAQALRLACEEIQKSLAARGLDARINIIAHSMGGLVVRYLLQKLDPLPAVASFITLGTPHWGTPMAYLTVSRSGRQMIPGCAFLKNLNQDLDSLPKGIRYLFVWADLDLIVPVCWANQENPWNREHMRFLPYHGHMSMLLTRAAYAVICDTLCVTEPTQV